VAVTHGHTETEKLKYKTVNMWRLDSGAIIVLVLVLVHNVFDCHLKVSLVADTVIGGATEN
jgi:hypothetical protein